MVCTHEGCVITADGDELLCHRTGRTLNLGRFPQGAKLSLSPDPGAEFVGHYKDSELTLVSTLTAETVCAVRTHTARFAIGCQTVAWACPEGIKAVRITAPHVPMWAFRIKGDYRFTFAPGDMLVVFIKKKELVETKCLWLSNMGIKHALCSAKKTSTVHPPSSMGPITLSPDGLASCVFDTPDGSAVASIHLARKIPCVADTRMLRVKTMTRGDLVVTHLSSVTRSSDGCTYALVSIEGVDMTTRKVLLIEHNGRNVSIDAGGSACMAGLSNGTCMLGIRDKPAVVVKPVMEADGMHVLRHKVGVPRIHKTPLRFGKIRRCDKCRRNVRGGDVSGLSTCDACSEKGSLAHSFGVAMRYAYNKYQFLPTKEETLALLTLFRKHPCCVFTRTNHQKKKLVYTKIDDNKMASADNLMLVRQDHAIYGNNKAVKRMARRWAIEAITAARAAL